MIEKEKEITPTQIAKLIKAEWLIPYIVSADKVMAMRINKLGNITRVFSFYTTQKGKDISEQLETYQYSLN